MPITAVDRAAGGFGPPTPEKSAFALSDIFFTELSTLPPATKSNGCKHTQRCKHSEAPVLRFRALKQSRAVLHIVQQLASLTSAIVRLPPKSRADLLLTTSMPLNMQSKCTCIASSPHWMRQRLTARRRVGERLQPHAERRPGRHFLPGTECEIVELQPAAQRAIFIQRHLPFLQFFRKPAITTRHT